MFKKKYFIFLFLIIFVFSAYIYKINYIDAAGASITINNVSLTLFNDSGAGNGIVNIGDSIRIDATITNTDNAVNGDCTTAVPTVTVDLTKYGGTASEPFFLNNCNNGAGDTWFIVFTVLDAGADGIDVGVADVSSQVTITASDSDDLGGVTLASDSMANPVDTIAPTVSISCIGVSGNNGLSGEFIIGDSLEMTWDNSNPGFGCTDGNTDIATVDFGVDNFLAGTTVGGVDTANVYNGTLSAMNISAQDDANNNFSVIATDDAGNITTVSRIDDFDVDTIAPGLARITTMTQSGNYPNTDSVLWYNYSGNALEAYIEGDETLDEVRVCIKSLIGVDPTETCDDIDFANPANYITSGSAVGANSYTFTLGDDFETIAGQPLVDMSGYSMNVLITDEVGNVYISPLPAEAFVMVWNINPSTFPGLGGITTDWSTIDDFTDVAGLTFEEATGLGKLVFTGSVDLTDPATVTALQDFSSNVQVGGNDDTGTAVIGIDSAAIAALNNPADLTVTVPGVDQPGIVVYADDGTTIDGYIDNTGVASLDNPPSDTISSVVWGAGTLTFHTDGFSFFGTDNTAPTKASSTPADGATSVSQTGTVSMTFSEAMDTTSFAFTDSTGMVYAPAVWSNTDKTVTLTHAGSWAAGTSVTITATTAKDASGNALSGSNTFLFTVAGTLANTGGSSGSYRSSLVLVPLNMIPPLTICPNGMTFASNCTVASVNNNVPIITSPNTTDNNKIIVFLKNLKNGNKGETVKNLQKYLNDHGFPVSLTGPGSKGNESLVFGPKTKNAVIKFQKANGLTPDGIVGPKTIQFINSHL